MVRLDKEEKVTCSNTVRHAAWLNCSFCPLMMYWHYRCSMEEGLVWPEGVRDGTEPLPGSTLQRGHFLLMGASSRWGSKPRFPIGSKHFPGCWDWQHQRAWAGLEFGQRIQPKCLKSETRGSGRKGMWNVTLRRRLRWDFNTVPEVIKGILWTMMPILEFR